MMTFCRVGARLVVVATAVFGLPAAADPAEQSAEARIELYTIGPGDYLFSRFGHAALCVVDSDGREGRCYNYGTADFSTPGPLTWAVLRGRAEFWVSVASLDEMLALYQAEDRTIYRQVLPLSREQTVETGRALATAALPENRRYRYNHFRDNCSTRPRDHIDTATNGLLATVAGNPQTSTFRSLIRESLNDEPLLFLLAETFLGRSMDRQRSEYAAMFLPRILRDGVQKHLRVDPDIVYARRATRESGPSLIVAHRLALAYAIGLAGGLAILISPPRVSFGLRGLFGCLFGVLGSAGWALAILSPLPVLRYNEILCAFVPTDFFLIFPARRLIFFYAGLRTAGLALAVLALVTGVLIQPLGTFLALTLPVLSASWARVLAPMLRSR